MTERGSMLPLAAGLVALCGVAIVGIVDSTDLALARTEIQSTADMAALVGAESFNPATALFDGEHVVVRLTDRRVRIAVRQFLIDTDTKTRFVSASTPDGVTARVTVRTDWSPPLGSEFFLHPIRLTATASARTVFGP